MYDSSNARTDVILGEDLFARSKTHFGKPRRLRKRGKKGDVRQRVRKLRRKNRVPLPSMILANVQSLRNKTDELQGNVLHLREYREACLMALTETWLTDMDSDTSLRISGFGTPVRLDRNCGVTRKSHRGGVCLYINQGWCNNFTVRERLCLPDIELLSVSVRPFYLPREFPQIFVTVVYIHPKADVKVAADAIFKVVHNLQTLSPDAPNFILGDFNNCNLKKSLNNFFQYVTCPTRHNKTLDLCYGPIKGAYKSVAGPALGSSDHNVIHLLPAYRSVIRREKACVKRTNVWTKDSCVALQGCFDCTDWSLFQESTSDLDELTDVVCSYISFCKDSVVPVREFKTFPNNKPWFSKDIKDLILKRKIAFNEGDVPTMRILRKEVRAAIKIAKMRHRNKIEAELSSNNLKRAWLGMKTMAGLQTKGKSNITLEEFTSDKHLADSLNSFYLRFENFDCSRQTSTLREKTITLPSICIDERGIANLFRHTKSKSPGPDNICGQVLRTCADQLSGIFHHIFSLSLELQTVPKIWKHVVIVPVAKGSSPKVLNDFRPVALTSLVMKSFEKIIKKEILMHVEHHLDPFQFAFRAGRGVEDAAVTLLHLLYKHLEAPHTHARLLFADFSSAFNTIQPFLLADRLYNHFKLDTSLVGWVTDFLTNRSQCVRVNHVFSDVLSFSTGSPQGCCLSPLLFILYTNECRSNFTNRHILKFADDTVIVSLLVGDESGHGQVVDDFVNWCDESFLSLNVSKTKDMIIGFRKSSYSSSPTIIKTADIGIVESYKYLGVVLDHKLCFESHADATTKKVQQRLFFFFF
ncbi:unnamed protein product [Oreochromis niloticus]|nr:unnamed protein product [Mustela putorius furo]